MQKRKQSEEEEKGVKEEGNMYTFNISFTSGRHPSSYVNINRTHNIPTPF
jgi:hypothetical protein